MCIWFVAQFRPNFWPKLSVSDCLIILSKQIHRPYKIIRMKILAGNLGEIIYFSNFGGKSISYSLLQLFTRVIVLNISLKFCTSQFWVLFWTFRVRNRTLPPCFSDAVIGCTDISNRVP